MIRRLTILLGLLFSMACSAQQSADDYDDIFQGLSISDEAKQRIIRFDQYAFNDQIENLFSLKNKARRQDKIIVSYSANTSPNNEHLSSNNSTSIALWPFLFSDTKHLNQTELFFLGVPSIDTVGLDAVKANLLRYFNSEIPASLLSDVIRSPENNCAVWRYTRDYQIVRSIVFIKTTDQASLSEQQIISEVSCINRGLFYHMGYSNVMAKPESQFVIRREAKSFNKTKLPVRYAFGASTVPPFTMRMRRGQYLGVERKRLLRLIAESEIGTQ